MNIDYKNDNTTNSVYALNFFEEKEIIFYKDYFLNKISQLISFNFMIIIIRPILKNNVFLSERENDNPLLGELGDNANIDFDCKGDNFNDNFDKQNNIEIPLIDFINNNLINNDNNLIDNKEE